jgi:lysophospholipase L1-like esterase
MIARIALGLAALSLAAGLGFWLWLEDQRTATWNLDFFEDAMLAFEAADREAPPPPGAIVFVGSSSIRMWSTLEADMAPLRVLNRGFGGSQMSHAIHNVDRIVTPYRPSRVLVYEGDNDLAEGTGKSAEVVLEDWQILVERIRARVPDVQIDFLAIKPSPLRIERWPEMKRANAMIEHWNAKDPRLGYVDVASPLLGDDGLPRESLFLFDGLHMNADGYAAWTAVVRAHLLANAEP